MLCLFLLLCVSSQIVLSSQTCAGEETKPRKLCTLPPHPKNGHYEVLAPDIPNLSSGDELSSFTLEIKCDPGYNNTDNVIYACFEDGSIFGDMSECLPLCTRVKNDVMSCGVGVSGTELRCIAPREVDDIWHYTPPLIDEEPVCGTLGLASSAIISGGHSAEQREMPWHVAIYTKTKRPYMQICGGTLVSTTVVISAAHCFWSDVHKQLPATNYAVAGGKLYRPWNDPHDHHAQKSDVSRRNKDPYFQGSATNLQDDIALVTLTSPFSFTDSVRPVCLDFDREKDRNQLAAGNLGKVAGWGLTSADGPASPVLKVVELPVVDIKQCFEQSEPAFQAHITSDKICAGYQNGTAVCKGDSGGGLCFPDQVRGRTRYFLRGVVSGAPSNDHLCNTEAWGSFTHVLKHEPFIRETIYGSSCHQGYGAQQSICNP